MHRTIDMKVETSERVILKTMCEGKTLRIHRVLFVLENESGDLEMVVDAASVGGLFLQEFIEPILNDDENLCTGYRTTEKGRLANERKNKK